eukprot:gene9195-19060_t
MATTTLPYIVGGVDSHKKINLGSNEASDHPRKVSNGAIVPSHSSTVSRRRSLVPFNTISEATEMIEKIIPRKMSQPTHLLPFTLTEKHGSDHSHQYNEISFPKKMKGESLPEFPGLVHRTKASLESEGLVNLAHMKLGDPLITALSNALQQHTLEVQCHHVIFRDNRLSDNGITELFQNLPHEHIISIDISENKIRKHGAEALTAFMGQCKSLRILSMEKLFDSDMILRILTAVPPAPLIRFPANLTRLTLSGNKISNEGAKLIAKTCLITGHLQELDLSWNDIRAEGGVAIAKAIANPQCLLEALDLSWNALGATVDSSRSEESASSALSGMLSDNSVLTHLDLSNNHLTPNDCKIIGTGLQRNHTVLGLHIAGNGGEHDSYGHLIPNSTPWPMEQGHVANRRIVISKPPTQTYDSNSSTSATASASSAPVMSVARNWGLREVCWICGFWRQTKLSCTVDTIAGSLQSVGRGAIVGRSSDRTGLTNLRVSILTSFDKWVPEILNTTELPSSSVSVPNSSVGQRGNGSNTTSTSTSVRKESVMCELYRMAPPGTHYYVLKLEHDGVEDFSEREVLFWNTSVPTVPSAELISLGVPVPPTLHLPPFVNVIEVNHILPRVKNTGLPVVYDEQQSWNVSDSVFGDERHLRPDSHNRHCFLQDWEYSKNPDMFAKVMHVLQENYQLLADIFAHYCGAYSSEEGMMTGLSYNELLQRCRLLELAPATTKGGLNAIMGPDRGIHKADTPLRGNNYANSPQFFGGSLGSMGGSMDVLDNDNDNENNAADANAMNMTTSMSAPELVSLSPSLGQGLGPAIVPLCANKRNSRNLGSFSRHGSLNGTGTGTGSSIKQEMMAALELALAAATAPVETTLIGSSTSATKSNSGSSANSQMSSSLAPGTVPTLHHPHGSLPPLDSSMLTSPLPLSVGTGMALDSPAAVRRNNELQKSMIGKIVTGSGSGSDSSSFSSSQRGRGSVSNKGQWELQSSSTPTKRRSRVGGDDVNTNTNSVMTSTVTLKAPTYLCSRTDVDMIFISNCISGPKHENNSRRSLFRFQFIDAMVDIAK